MSLGESNLSKPLSGYWSLPSFPDEILLGDRLFRKAKWRQEYEGVIEQYREAVVQDSGHMKVYANGVWEIDHVDEDNPDMGRPVEHFFNDHPVGKAIKVVGVFALAAAAVGIVAGAFSNE